MRTVKTLDTGFIEKCIAGLGLPLFLHKVYWDKYYIKHSGSDKNEFILFTDNDYNWQIDGANFMVSEATNETILDFLTQYAKSNGYSQSQMQFE